MPINKKILCRALNFDGVVYNPGIQKICKHLQGSMRMPGWFYMAESLP
jgi:hypothetical protein